MRPITAAACVLLSACTRAPAPASASASASASAPASASASAPFDEAYVRRELEGMQALRLARRRIALLDRAASDPSRGRIPDNWRSFDAVLLRLEETPTSYEGDALSGISIDWSAPSIDGRVYVMVTKEQIYLRSGHNNPHQNHLYWLAAVTPEQYAAVEELLRKRGAAVSVSCGREGTRPDDCSFRAPHAERRDGSDHLLITAKNLAALVASLNRLLPKEVARLPLPAPSDLERKVLVSKMADELADWLHAR